MVGGTKISAGHLPRLGRTGRVTSQEASDLGET